MPWTPQQIADASFTSLDFFVRNKPPVDQINIAHPFLNLLESNKKPFDGGKQYIVHQIYTSNDDNTGWFGSDDQVGYNNRKNIKQASFLWSNVHGGYSLTEEQLLQNGISVTDNMSVTPTREEIVQLSSILDANNMAIKEGHDAFLDYQLFLDGTQSTDAVPGLDALVSTTPTTGTVGGINRATAGNEYWRNNVNTGISTATAGNLVEAMEIEWRKCTRYGGEQPNAIIVGSKFLDAYRKDAKDTVDRQIIMQGNGRTSPSMNAGVTGIYFKGVELIWAPVLDQLEADFPGSTIDWDKRCYFLNTKYLQLNPAKDQWKVPRKPPRVYDRYTHYSAMTSRFGLGITKPNTMSVLSIA